MARPTVQQFITTWEKSASVSEVAGKTSLTKSTVQAKATQLRRLGIPLKKFKGSRHPINIQEALETLAKIRGTSVAVVKKEAEAAAKRRSERSRRKAEPAKKLKRSERLQRRWAEASAACPGAKAQRRNPDRVALFAKPQAIGSRVRSRRSPFQSLYPQSLSPAHAFLSARRRSTSLRMIFRRRICVGVTSTNSSSAMNSSASSAIR